MYPWAHPQPPPRSVWTYLVVAPKYNGQRFCRVFRSSPPSNVFDCNCSFEAENGIKQEARGEMRRVEDVDVIVMRGSYSYPGMLSLVIQNTTGSAVLSTT